MAEKQIAIVGANSFLAHYVIKQLHSPAHHLHLYGRREILTDGAHTFSYFSYPDGPLNFEALLPFDTIIYTAGAGIQSNIPASADAIFQVNAFLPISLIQYLQDNKYEGQVITFGSYFEIGNSAEDKFYTEEEYVTNANRVPNNYCLSKRLLSQYISQKISGLPFSLTHFVLPNIYGVGENPARLIPYLVESIKSKKPLHLSSGTQQRQFLHARDAAAMIEKVVHEPKVGIYNLGEKNVISIKELVNIVVAEMPDHKGIEINFGSLSKGDAGMQFLALDTSKAEKELGWNASISLREGIREYI